MKSKLIKEYEHHDLYEITDSRGNKYKTSVKKGTKPQFGKKSVSRKGRPVEYGSNQFKWGHDLFQDEY